MGSLAEVTGAFLDLVRLRYGCARRPGAVLARRRRLAVGVGCPTGFLRFCRARPGGGHVVKSRSRQRWTRRAASGCRRPNAAPYVHTSTEVKGAAMSGKCV